MKEGEESYYYKYKVNENNGTYSLIQSFKKFHILLMSAVHRSIRKYYYRFRYRGIFGEYDASENIIQEFEMELADEYIYRVYKYDFADFYFEKQ